MAGTELLDQTDWTRLRHAYGVADDLPDRLVPLLCGDPAAVARALAVLDGVVLHQGSIYSATTPAALFVAGILADPGTEISCGSGLRWDSRVRPLRAALLEWLGLAAASAVDEPPNGWDEGADDDLAEPDDEFTQQLRDLVAFQAVRPRLYRAVAPFLDSPDESVAAAALYAAGQLLHASDLAADRAALARRLQRPAAAASAAQRARAALTLAGWGHSPGRYLADPHPAVRAYAAIAPTLDDDPVALAEVRAALRDPATADAWFEGADFPQLTGWFREHLVTALLRRTRTFEDVEAEAMAVATTRHQHAGVIGLAPLLRRAFHPPGRPLTPAAARFRAVVNRPQPPAGS